MNPAVGRARYLREFVAHRRALLAAFVGMGSGYTINNYTNNLFIPALMAEFGWQRSDIALVGAAAMLSVVCQPLAGRIADRVGPARVALFGTLAGAAVFLLLSLMTGAFAVFAGLVMLQIALVASTTGAVVFSRPIAGAFDRARGLALSLAICAPSLVGALLSPRLAAFIADQGWRAGYRVVALFTLVFGLLAVRLLRGVGKPHAHAAPTGPAATGGATWRTLGRSRAIWLITAGMVLCSLSISLQTTQLKVVLLDLDVGPASASGLIAIYALGVIAGRLVSGLALDFLPTRVVACAAMALPGVGLLILALGGGGWGLLVIAMLTLGLALGAEGDIAGYLIMSYVDPRFYSASLGILIGAIAFASGAGGLLLSAVLRAAGSFAPFLLVTGGSALVGGCLFLALPTPRPARRPTDGDGAPLSAATEA